MFRRTLLALVVLLVAFLGLRRLFFQKQPGESSGAATGQALDPDKWKATEIVWVDIPAGSFMMGSDDVDSHKPRHQVRVQAFQLAKTEVTFAQYKKCVDAGACEPTNVDARGGDYPVTGVTWTQAQAFSTWAGGRLPSEAEWEYAARSAGQEQAYPWGNEQPTCDKLVSSDCGNAPAPVCSKPAGNTQQGLCDMAGNVWEWVQDWHHNTYQGAPADGSAWETPPAQNRGLRGGAWYEHSANARATYRHYFAVEGVRDMIGFRPARSPR